MKRKMAVIFSCLVAVCLLAACGAERGTNVQNSENQTPQQDITSESIGTQESENIQPQEMTEERSELDSVENEDAAPTENESGKTLVVYYSATGHTEDVAKMIAEAEGADLFELVSEEPYSDDDLNWNDKNSRVCYEHDNPDERNVQLVSVEVPEWDSYTTVYIGYPIWWQIAAWAVDPFVTANDFTGKTVIPFCTSSSSDMGESGTLLAEMAGTGDWLEGKRFRSSASESDVAEWMEELHP